jgi:hypothetical protein
MDLPMCENGAADFSPEDQQRELERAWEIGGFRFLFNTFNDVWLDGTANEIASEFIRSKIRAIVKDPATAELLCPKYPLAAKRPPCGHGYYEAYNRDNVSLVDVSENPITEILPTGLRTATEVYEADIIIFATGFDAITGAAQGIDIRGRGDRNLRDVWEGVPRSYLGLAVDGFPNMLTLAGPMGPSPTARPWWSSRSNSSPPRSNTWSSTTRLPWKRTPAPSIRGSTMSKKYSKAQPWPRPNPPTPGSSARTFPVSPAASWPISVARERTSIDSMKKSQPASRAFALTTSTERTAQPAIAATG